METFTKLFGSSSTLGSSLHSGQGSRVPLYGAAERG